MDTDTTKPQKKKRRILLLIICLLLLLLAGLVGVYKNGVKTPQQAATAISPSAAATAASKATETDPGNAATKAANADNAISITAHSTISGTETKKDTAVVKDASDDLGTQKNNYIVAADDSEYLALDSTFDKEVRKIMESGADNFEKYKGPLISIEPGDTIYSTTIKSEFETTIDHCKDGPVFRVILYRGPGRDYAYELQHEVFNDLIAKQLMGLWPTLHSRFHLYTFLYRDMELGYGVVDDTDDNYISKIEMRHQ